MITILQIFINGNQVHTIKERNEYKCNDNLSYYESQHHLQVRKAACLYHTRNGNEGDSGNGGTDHGKGNDIPG